jgi:putative membrane protein
MLRALMIATALGLSSGDVASADVFGELPITPETLWRGWNWDLLILLNLSVLASWYLLGINRLWRKSGSERRVGPVQAVAYLSSLGVLLVALISPLHALSEELTSAHMVQHMLLMVVAAPLFVLGSPGLVLMCGLAPQWRPVVAGWRRWVDADVLRRPLLPSVLYAAALWIWHLPIAYEAALVDPLVHDAEHLSFFVAACLYWRALLDQLRLRALHPLIAVMIHFVTSLHAMVLGVFMALAPTVWYEAYASRTTAWGLTPLEDQQMAGLIMWLPACLIYPAVAAAALGHWLAGLSESHQRRTGQPA